MQTIFTTTYFKRQTFCKGMNTEINVIELVRSNYEHNVRIIYSLNYISSVLTNINCKSFLGSRTSISTTSEQESFMEMLLTLA